MMENTKGKSPFYPGQPVPVELFVGRAEQIDRILIRGVNQVINGKPVAMYLQGEYGIGKSSLAGVVQRLAEKKGLHGIYVSLGGVSDLTEVAQRVLEATINSGAFDPSKSEKIREWLAKYIGQQALFGVSLNFEAIKNDAPKLATAFGLLGFLTEVRERLQENNVNGIFLVFDEINGIATEPKFAHFVKGLVDENALSRKQLPLLLMFCGVEQRRREMIQKHQPIDRIFDVIEIKTMNKGEMEDFFSKAFQSVHLEVEKNALDVLTHNSAGFPKIMHLVGDAAYWLNQGDKISLEDAFRAVIEAADEVGKKYVDQQVYKELRSDDYRSILKKIVQSGGPISMNFNKSEIASKLTEKENKKLNNFLQKMKKLKVIKSGKTRGEYVFILRMARLYIWLQSSVDTRE